MIRGLPIPASRTSWLADVPVDLGRDEAQDLARRELADPSYDAEPSLLQGAVDWFLEQLAELLSRTTGALSGWVGVAVLGGLAALVAVVVVLRVGPLASRAASGKAVFSGSRRSAAEYRADADDAAARGDWSAAVVERYRAVVAGMEERGVLDPRPGRTADEAAAAGGSILPGVAGDLATGSRVFDGVRYGDRAATSADDAEMRRLDEAVRTARPGHAAERRRLGARGADMSRVRAVVPAPAEDVARPAAPTTSEPLDPRLADRWRRWRPVVIVVGLMLVTAIVLGVIASQGRRGYLDPAAVDPSGSRALARLLETQGVRVEEVRTADDAVGAGGVGTTVLVTVPDLLPTEQVTRLTAAGADLVLIEPADVVSDFNSAFEVAFVENDDELDPGCDLAEAERAGSARVGGLFYDAPDAAESCYRADGAGSLVVGTIGDGARLVVLGTGAPLMNQYLDEDGNASLALGLLGGNPRLVWYRPTIEEMTGQQASFTELLPDWVVPVLWQLGVAAVLAALWRARRLGRVVTEPLPVVVRAAEATEGRARLYRRGRASDHVAATLRDAAVVRLRSRLGLPPDAGPAAVADAVATRTGRPPTEVAAVLSGPAPPDDAALVRLADTLDTLEQEVRTP